MKLLKGQHKRKTTEMEIQMRRQEERNLHLSDVTELPTETSELQQLVNNLRLEKRMAESDKKIYQGRLSEYKNQLNYQEEAENLQTLLEEAQSAKIQVIKSCSAEIDELRRIIRGLVTRGPSDDLKQGFNKSYAIAQIWANQFHKKYLGGSE